MRQSALNSKHPIYVRENSPHSIKSILKSSSSKVRVKGKRSTSKHSKSLDGVKKQAAKVKNLLFTQK